MYLLFISITKKVAVMTKKGELLSEKILSILDRNPDGVRIGTFQTLLNCSRNTIYRYLDELQDRGVVKKHAKIYLLTRPLKPQTILGYQYQALLQGLKLVGGGAWDIDTDLGKQNFKKLGYTLLPKMKKSKINLENLKAQTHRLQDIVHYMLKLLEEVSTVEKFEYILKLDKNGFPDPNHLAAIISYEGGYTQTDPVEGNGFAHYYIIIGLIEAAGNLVISPIFGGRLVADVLKIDFQRQIVDIGLYMFFDTKNPYIDPKTGQHIVLQ